MLLSKLTRGTRDPGSPSTYSSVSFQQNKVKDAQINVSGIVTLQLHWETGNWNQAAVVVVVVVVVGIVIVIVVVVVICVVFKDLDIS